MTWGQLQKGYGLLSAPHLIVTVLSEARTLGGRVGAPAASTPWPVIGGPPCGDVCVSFLTGAGQVCAVKHLPELNSTGVGGGGQSPEPGRTQR